MRVCTVGTGYVGLSTATCLAFLGHQVRGFDVDKRKIALLQRDVLPIHEPGLEELLGLAKKNITFVDDPAFAVGDAEVIFVTVGTPSLADGRPDLRCLESAAEMIGKHLGETFAVVVNKSTVPIGANAYVEGLIRKSYRTNHPESNERFAVAYNPEFLRQGSAMQDSLYPDRIVVGSDSVQALERLNALYRPVIDQNFRAPRFLPRPEHLRRIPVVTAALASAEIIKYAANAFLALKISLANELAELSERVNADISEVARGMGLDRRIGPQFLQAGLGWGGSCFGKDTAALVEMARGRGIDMRIVRAAREVNFSQRERAVAKLEQELDSLEGKVVGLLGLAFKPHTDDLRDAPALDIARQLLARGARVRAHDPVALERARLECRTSGIEFCESVNSLVEGAHALILVTEWTHYQNLPWNKLGAAMCNRLILDGRNVLDRVALESGGFRYLGMGRTQPRSIRPADMSGHAWVDRPTTTQETAFGILGNDLLAQALPVSG